MEFIIIDVISQVKKRGGEEGEDKAENQNKPPPLLFPYIVLFNFFSVLMLMGP